MEEERITGIEIHLMHQAKAIEELNEVVIRQQRQIDDLTADIARIREQLQGLVPSAVREPVEEEPPPHY
jgi:SlyX protein